MTFIEIIERRKTILDRAGNKCEHCGATNNLHVAHLDHDRYNEPETPRLAALCRECHVKYDYRTHPTYKLRLVGVVEGNPVTVRKMLSIAGYSEAKIYQMCGLKYDQWKEFEYREQIRRMLAELLFIIATTVLKVPSFKIEPSNTPRTLFLPTHKTKICNPAPYKGPYFSGIALLSSLNCL